jgi:glycosyltransferase involved in cell wall biosynthesis
MPDISVALCTHQGERFLEEQLGSIAGQTHPPAELVVCDDHSSDRTQQILEDFRRHCAFEVRVSVNEQPVGPLRNFEQATSLCTGEVIFFSDQDDVWHPDKLAKMMAALDRSPKAGLVICNAEVVNESLRSAGYTLWQFRRLVGARLESLQQGEALNFIVGQGIANGMCLGFRSSFKDLVLPFEGLIHDLWVSILVGATSEVAVVPECLALWRQHPGQQSGAVTVRSVGRRITESRSHNRDHYAELVQGYGAALKRLLDRSDRYPRSPGAIPLLEAKISHTRARADMRAGKGRFKQVLAEAASGNYWRYSYGLRSIAKDLLF